MIINRLHFKFYFSNVGEVQFYKNIITFQVVVSIFKQII